MENTKKTYIKWREKSVSFFLLWYSFNDYSAGFCLEDPKYLQRIGMGQKAIFSSHEFDQNNSQEVLQHTQSCQHLIFSPLQETVLWMRRLTVWEEPAETTNGSIIWLIKLVKISRNVQRAFVSVNLFHDLAAWLKAVWPVFASTIKGFLKEPFNCDHGFSNTVKTKEWLKSYRHFSTQTPANQYIFFLRTRFCIIRSLCILNELIHQHSSCRKLPFVSCTLDSSIWNHSTSIESSL